MPTNFRLLLATIFFAAAGDVLPSRSAIAATAEIKVDKLNKVVVLTSSKDTTNSEAETLTNSPVLMATVSDVTDGRLTPVVNNLKQNPVPVSAASKTIILNKEGKNVVFVSYTSAGDASEDGDAVEAEQIVAANSNFIVVELDRIGPLMKHAEMVDVPKLGTTLIVTFADDDFMTSTVAPSAFTIGRKGITNEYDETIQPQAAIVEGRTVRLPFAALPPGEYEITVKANVLKDKAGNFAGATVTTSPSGTPQSWVFSVMSDRKFGEHVEFTPYAPPQKQPIPEEGFNPGDYVETRVARLFYYRDAHRVAQIINRNIRSYNQAAVTLAERRAEDSRDNADLRTDERRRKEREAVRAAEKARKEEQELAAARQTLAEAQRLEGMQTTLESQQADLETRIAELGEESQDDDTRAANRAGLKTQLATVEQRINNTVRELVHYGSISELSAKVSVLQQSVASLRETELQSKDARDDAEAEEARARAAQFRNEVTAAETDPDTYVAGDMDSVDPVTQCSLSVIGEGLIQIRGPIKGINKIRTMINQIDSPVGQIKIGIFSVQVNGEQGDKMEKVVGDAEGFIDLSRFLVNQSLNLLRRAIQTEAAVIAEQCELDGHYQVDRDRRYLYAFFGRDFIDELYEMNSEFMFTENKLLSLHAMDTISFNRAMFMLALAKNDVRERIVIRFLESAKTELPDAEFDFRRSSELKPHRTQKHFPYWNLTHLPISNHHHQEQVIHEAVHRNALQRYHFRNFSGFFDAGFTSADTMNPMQREFIRLAQIFKARLVAEMEWKQRVLERGLIEDRSNDENEIFNVLTSVRDKAYVQLRDAYDGVLNANGKLASADAMLIGIEAELRELPDRNQLTKEVQDLVSTVNGLGKDFQEARTADVQLSLEDFLKSFYARDTRFMKIEQRLSSLAGATWLSAEDGRRIAAAFQTLKNRRENNVAPKLVSDLLPIFNMLANRKEAWEAMPARTRLFGDDVRNTNTTLAQLDQSYDSVRDALENVIDTELGNRINDLYTQIYADKRNFVATNHTLEFVKAFLTETRAPLDHRKLLNHLIDEQEDKFIELVEGTRSHISVMDQHLKRLSIALEDDFKVQFYDPAFVRIREAARGKPVNLSQVERTTILTNNRALAKVDPQATLEFDLPKRQIAIKETFDAAKALVEDTGALMNDPTFLSAFQIMGGAALPSTVKNLIPGQSLSTDQQLMGLAPPPPAQSTPGSALQNLVPEPAIYKIETGTGFQIRPLMQPDGDSAVYDFDYMYTTNIREPVRADEKHVGRIKRHFVHTAVQTGNFELREISRYQVALKVSRTGQGVPLLQDIPVMGALFRPAPSAESSLQQNIIFGQTNIYPTLFDLMGLRWAQQVVDLDHTSLLETEHVIRGRQKSMKDYVFGVASRRVDEFLNVQREAPNSYRPDFYHEQSLSSPYHPNGYRHPIALPDPTGNDFERIDRRPPEMQDPPYDRYRHQPVHPERIAPQIPPQRIPPQDDPLSAPYGESRINFKRLPQTHLKELEALLLQGPTGASEQSRRPQLHEDASVDRAQLRRASGLGRAVSMRTETVAPSGGVGRLQTALTVPHLRPTPPRTYGGPDTGYNSAVVPASFERVYAPTRKRIQRLPPVK